MYCLKLFFLSFCLFLTHFALSQKPDLRFKHINTRNGLSHSNVKSVVRDYQGFMWFGSAHGLNKYNGYEIEVYRNSENDSTSLRSNDINFLYEDSRKNLWVATINGLDRYERAQDNFIKHNEFGNDIVSHIYEDKNQNLWAVAGYHLFGFDRDSSKFKNFLNCNSNIHDILQDSKGNFWVSADKMYLLHDDSIVQHPIADKVPYINKLYEDSKDNIWMLSYGNGLYKYDIADDRLLHFSEQNSDLTSNSVTAINEDKHGNIWVGSLHNGLSIYNSPSETFYNFISIPGDEESLGFNSIKCIYRDLYDNLWIGTYSSGVDFVTERKFGLLNSNPFVENSLNNNSIIALSEGRNGKLLIGTDGGGFNIFDPDKESVKYLTHVPNDPSSIGSNIVSAIHEDSYGNIWIGCWDAGLHMINQENQVVKKFGKNHKNPDNSLLNNSILSLLEDENGYLWIGSLEGLNRLDLETYEMKSFSYHYKGLTNYVNCLKDAGNGKIWLGTWSGLALFDKKTHKYKWFNSSKNDNNSISDDKLFALFDDSKGRFWIGTSGGLNLFNKEDSTFQVYRVKDGLPSNAVYGIVEDGSGNLWLSTSNGISKFNPEDESFTNFTVHDGLQDNQFKEHAYEGLNSGMIAFGGINGINIFCPDNIVINQTPPKIAFTDFKLFNESVKIDQEDSPLKKNISLAEEIVLSYDQTVISFEFAALNFISPDNNQYAYILEGFDKDWNEVKNRRSAFYTNLQPGHYTFKVIASNNDKVWNTEPIQLNLTITPPFWKTWWFKTLIFIILVGSIAFAYLLRVRDIKHQKILLEQKVNEQTSELREAADSLLKKNKELDNFAYIVSHDLKAPLRAIDTLSNWIVKDFKHVLDPDAQNIIQHLQNSVKRMQRLIDGILTYSRVGRIETSNEEVDIQALLIDVREGLDIPEQFEVNISGQMPEIKSNFTALHQVFSNLLSNSIKYHDKNHGVIEVNYTEKDTHHQFSVKDDGPGIDPDYHEKIFQIFQTLQASESKESTGIGLSIVKKIVEDLSGEIWVESDGKSGSNFVFTVKKQ